MELEGTWRTLGKLPHFDGRNLPQFITWRCADSVPQSQLKFILSETDSLEPLEMTKARQSLIEKAMDSGHGECLLRPQQYGHFVQEELLRFDEVLYVLHAWVVMPNHVHVLLTPNEDVDLGKIMHRVKGGSAHRVNQARKGSGTFWQADYFDRFARSEDSFRRIAEYIHGNPSKVGLCKSAEEWPLSSARRIHRTGAFVVREMPGEYGEEFDPFLLD